MIPIVYKIYNLGTQEIEEDYKIAVVRISNIIAFIFLMTGVIYGSISAYLAPQLVNICILLFVGSTVILLLNYLQFVNLSRFVLSLVISLDVAIYHGYIVQPGEMLIVSIYIGQFVVAVLPWIYIDIREKRLLISALTITFLILVAQPLTNEFLSIEMDSGIFREIVFTITTYTFSIATLLFCMYLLQYKNLMTDKSSKKLLRDIQDRNKLMEEQQEKLVNTLEKNKVANEAEEKRNWIAQGISEIGSLMRGNIDNNFYRHLVSAVVNFMHVNQVGLYIVEEDKNQEFGEKYIELKSCYAFDRNKFLKKKIEIGQGLIGQCYLEKERIYLKEVPESYINITSGLGGSTPKCILIVPLIYEGNVQGVIEIASFNELEQHETDFVEKLSEALASFISSNKINMNTKELLEKSQQLGEQLHAQEEEMRQNMEEMQATQEEMTRKEREYLERIEELDKELAASKEVYDKSL
ncbi:MAG: hypothetical protein E2O83_08895 [Bacteroidetes bacterium]|nr:MAG: hypothetical protein E2O83_08895 [Bacteroidota bacterium]